MATEALRLSVLDVVPVTAGGSASQALGRVVSLAQLADEAGYERLWFAEHHGMHAIASSSPEILIAHAAAATRRIRVGSGGVMLPNHVPLRVAETYRTLAALHPDRIDLGIGRAAGTDPLTASALRSYAVDEFASQLGELLAFGGERDFPKGHPFGKIAVVPDAPLPPIWLLGSSGASARAAGQLGIGYGFAQHFSPTPAAPAIRAYREAFEPSARFKDPHAILALSVVVASSSERAHALAAPMALVWLRLRKGDTGPLPTPEECAAYPWTAAERAIVAPLVALQVIGTPEEVAPILRAKAREAHADEVMVTTFVADHEARLTSYRLLAEAMDLPRA